MVNPAADQVRCAWANVSELDIEYHDTEWGVPVYDDQMLFEMLTLEAAQAGLSWSTILKKRQGYREVFAGFDIATVAAFDEARIQTILQDTRIVRNKLKVNATVNNANAILRLQKEKGSFSDYIWEFVDHKPIVNQWKTLSEVPGKTELSDALCKDLKKQGFRFVGSTICYAFLQTAGLVNDHLTSCFRHPDRL